MPSFADRAIDINADVGEGPGEEPLYPFITSANVACGGHAGDEASMRDAVRLALRFGVAIGAHPSYPDRAGFGRSSFNLPLDELARAVEGQTSALVAAAASLGAPVSHVKPHGALYNDAARNSDAALAIARGVAAVSTGLTLVGLAGSSMLDVWLEQGFAVAAEGFADRAYASDGSLVPRGAPDALLDDPAAAATQALRLAESGRCDTICVHADTPGAALILAAVRRGLEEAGFTLRALVPGPPPT